MYRPAAAIQRLTKRAFRRHIRDNSAAWNRPRRRHVAFHRRGPAARRPPMTRTLLATTLLAALALPAFAAQAAAPVPTESYRYGMPLDVHKVVATQEQASTTCEIVDARMDYLDSAGKLHSLAYRKYASACNQGG
ncbi:hypothetical protein VNPA120719_22290 [Pseudomonas aeruginosa]|nr:hypothetical protein VNPA110516_39030 [Pseudomonas aeruginosa]GLE75578.1 hypothetical protein VNPA120641_24440 [Pseudomonas aeruginosa]GLE88840.1 hypothetical protein VNPA120719_22290 [Pseudomonas aeruginosa]